LRYHYSERKLTGDIFVELLYHRNFIATNTVVIKRSILEKVGLFDESMYSLEDYDLWLRVASVHSVGFISSVLAYVTERSNSLSKDYWKWSQGNAIIVDKIDKIIPSHVHVRKRFLDRLHGDKYSFLAKGFLYDGDLRKALRYYCKSIYRFPFQRRVYWLSLSVLLEILKRGHGLRTH